MNNEPSTYITSDRLAVFIPTYNEANNVKPLVDILLALPLNLTVLFIDDNSPDGTGKLLDEISKQETRVSVIHGEEKKGIGYAHKIGIAWAYKNGFTTLVTMDCDFTHDPTEVPKLVSNLSGYDVVVGSRFVAEKSMKGWKAHRRLLSHLGHLLATYCLDLPNDATGAFRVYNLKKVSPKVFDLVKSNGYSFFFESLFLIKKNKYSIIDVPITAVSRVHGDSKMTSFDVLRSLQTFCTLLMRNIFFSKELRLPTNNMAYK